MKSDGGLCCFEILFLLWLIIFAGFELIHVDEFVDELLMEERHSDIILPRLTVTEYFFD